MRRRTTTKLATGAAIAALALSACGGSGSTDTGGGGGEGKLEVFSWWTSGSEEAALKVLFDAFTTAQSGTEIVNAAVSGGGGGNAQQVLQTRLQGGNPPDSWQLHPDQDLFATVDDGNARDITDLYEEGGWADKLPETIRGMVEKDDAYWAAPINAHRANVLWTSVPMLTNAGITWDANTTVDQLIADLQKIKAAGGTPLCLGDKDVFASAQLLESVIVAEVGPDGWNKLFTGDMSFDDPAVRGAVEKFGTLLDLSNPDHSALTWDQALTRMADGQCAATLMGDWAYGELLNAGKKEGTDFGYLPFPGTNGTFVFVGDAFVIPPEGGPNPEGEVEWIKVVMDPEVQKNFNLLKGSSPIRTDVPLDEYPPYQQQAAQSLRQDKVVSSLAHRQVAPAEFAQTYADAVTSFTGSQNVDAFIKTMTSAQETQLTQ